MTHGIRTFNTSGSVVIILAIAVASIAAIYPTIFSMQFSMVREDLLKRQNASRERDFFHYVNSHVDCEIVKAGPCTPEIALLTESGAVFIPATPSSIGPFQIQPRCETPDNVILLEYAQRPSSNVEQRVICP